MQPSYMDILLTDAVAKAVCWTLVHSIWQGMIAAFVAGAIILATRKSTAVVRYNLLTADLVLFLVVAVGTFTYELRQGSVAGGEEPCGQAVVVHAIRAGGAVTGMAMRYDAVAPALLYRINGALNRHAELVVMVWMACLLVQLVRMTGGLYKVHRLRRHRVFLAAEFWQDRMSVLMERLGIRKKVVLLQSGSVTMPVTFGFLKPSILVPLGLLTNLPVDQVETIILHELAHIRRSDYLANLLLHIGEAIFFFNPGVRWVAWLVRQEREACCDDLVLAGTRNRNSYFEALIAFLKVDGAGGQTMALPLSGGQPDLVWRIRRMLNQENKKLHLMEKTILSFGLMAVMAIGLVSMKGTGVLGAAGSTVAAVIRVAGSPGPARVSVGEATDSVPLSKKPTAASKAPVAMTDTSDASANMLDSMSATSVGPKGLSITFLATHISAKNAATMAGAVMKIANAKSTEGVPVAVVEAPVAMVGAPVAPMTVIAMPMTPPPAPRVVENDLIKGIIKDLKMKGVIQGEEPLSFRLDKHRMMVNGVEVSAEVFAFFKEKYVTNPRNKFSYSHEGGSTSSTVWVY